MRILLTAIASLLLLVLCMSDATALGEAVNGFPKWEERVLHQWTNRARSDPQLEMTACGAACGEAACYAQVSPLTDNINLSRSARFHSDEMLRQSYFNHPSACTVVSNINSLYPAICNGSASCACVGGMQTCSTTCTDTFARIALFGTSGSGEIIASSTDPDFAFYQWLREVSSDTTCAFSIPNGHRWLILKSTGAVGYGVSGPSVGNFGSGPAPAKIPSGSHYPRQSSSVQIWTTWFDTAAPSEARVNVDGTCTPMTRARGTTNNAAYTTTLTNVASGCHRYYFEFKDSANNAVTYPTTGSLGIGPSATCPDWDIARPTSCDVPPVFALSVTKAGTGSGTVTSNPAGINCGATCSANFNTGTMVTLTASPSMNNNFTGWSGGGCSGTGTCGVTVNAATNVTATFTAFTAPDPPVIVSATPGNAQVSVAFNPPANNGGAPVSDYTAQCAGMPTAFNTGMGSPIVVTGMVNGQSYTCGVIATNLIGNSAPSGLILVTPNTGMPLALTGVVSRKTHVNPPPFDLPIDYTVQSTGAVSVEPRGIGTGHALVFQFNQLIFSAGTVSATDSVSGAIAGVMGTPSSNEVVVPLTGIPDNRRITVDLVNVNGVGVNARATVGFLVGDVNSTRIVTASDLSAVKARLTAPVNGSNFRFDFDLSGAINAIDVNMAKSRAGQRLP